MCTLGFHRFRRPLSLVLAAVLTLLVWSQTASACDVAVVSAQASATGRPFIWKNFDCSSYWRQEMKYYPAANPSVGGYYLLYHNDDTMALANNGDPLTPQAAMNEAGFAISVAAVYEDFNPLHESKNLNTDLVKDAAANCKTIAEFEAYIKVWPTQHSGHPISANYVVIDAHGGAALYEMYTGRWTDMGKPMPIQYRKFDANTGIATNHLGQMITVSQPSPFPGFVNRTNLNNYIPFNPGRERAARATELLTKLAEDGDLSPEKIMFKVAKDTIGQQLNIPGGGDTKYSMTYCISRSQTRSGSVIEGVAPGGDPRLTTYWCAFGEPSVSVFVPTLAGSHSVTDYVYIDTLLPNGILADINDGCLLTNAEDLRETCNLELYESNRGNPIFGPDDKFINRLILYAIQKWTHPLEKIVVDKTNEYLAFYREHPDLIDPAEFQAFQQYCHRFVYENYLLTSPWAVSWEYPMPSIPKQTTPASPEQAARAAAAGLTQPQTPATVTDQVYSQTPDPGPSPGTNPADPDTNKETPSTTVTDQVYSGSTETVPQP